MHGRHDLPWRQTHDVYKILVSEVMLQQTQVERVIPFYRAFLKKFPTAKKLAAAPLADVLTAWQGLGYNRRAKMLQQAAKVLATKNVTTIEELEALPGVGPYTARAVAAFAWNKGGIVIETNIRTAVIEHFFTPAKNRNTIIYDSVSDAEIEKSLAKCLPKGRAREWYSALMDYGASLKRSGISHNAKSAAHTKQPKFAGSLRQARGAILRELAKDSQTKKRLVGLLGDVRTAQLTHALSALVAEGLVEERRRSRYALAGSPR